MPPAAGKPKGLDRSRRKGTDVPQKRLAIVEIAQRLGGTIPAQEMRRIPKDLSDRIDHYVYGTPTR